MGKKLEQSAHQRDEYERIIVNQMESGTIGEITRPAHRKQSVLYASQGSGQGNSGHHKGQNVVWCQCQTTLPSKQRQWLHAQRTLLTFTPVEYTTSSKDVTKPANWRYWEGIGIRVEDRCLSFPVHVGRREDDFQFTRVPFTAESSQAVVRETVATTKVRMLFDVNARPHYLASSVNDCMHSEPSLHLLLWNILLQARMSPNLLIGDIGKA